MLPKRAVNITQGVKLSNCLPAFRHHLMLSISQEAASATWRQHDVTPLCRLSLRHHTSSCRLHWFIAGRTSTVPLCIHHQSCARTAVQPPVIFPHFRPVPPLPVCPSPTSPLPLLSTRGLARPPTILEHLQYKYVH